VFERVRSGRVWPALGAGVLIGLVEVVLAVAFATLVFNGYLYEFKREAIGLYLAGAAIALAGIALTAGRRGVVGGVQEAAAAVLVLVTMKVAVSAFGSPYRAFLTAVAATLVVTLATGLVLLLLGAFRLGRLIRLVPYPVVGGFLAGTGWLLLKGGVGVAAGTELYLRTMNLFDNSFQLARWIPAFVFGVLILVATRVWKRPMVMPIAVAIALVLFGIGLLVSGLTVDDAWNGGWMFGPFATDRLLEPWTYRALTGYGAVTGADWWAILQQSGAIATAVVVAVIACFSNVGRVELMSEKDLDADQELRAAGVTSLVAGPFGGIPSYHAPALTSLARGMRPGAREVGLVAALVPAAATLFGGRLIELIPRFVIGGVLIFVGLAFIAEWLVDAWRDLTPGEYAVVLAIFGTIAARGYLAGIIVGFVASVVLFAFNYSRIELVRQVEFGTTYRSNVERPAADRLALRQLADRVMVLRVNGFVFFGVASDLVERIRTRVKAGPLRSLLVDLRRATGMDSSAMLAFQKVAQLADAAGFELVFSDAPEAIRAKLAGGGIVPAEGVVRFEPDLDRALEHCEDGLLADLHRVASPDGAGDPLAGLPDGLREYFQGETVPQGTVLIHQGAPADDLFVLESGRLEVEATSPEGTRMRLSSASSGVMVGEVAWYLGGQRTADVIAETECEVLRLSRASMERMERDEPELAVALHRRLAESLAERSREAVRVFDELLG
jgi:SulP family sulfate permease